MSTNLDMIAQAIVDAPVTDEQRRAATPLVEAYCAKFNLEHQRYVTIAAENPWYYWLTPNTLLIGVMDANRIDTFDGGFDDLELKTRRAPRVKKNGEPYRGDTESDWVAELINGSQIGFYALARAKATFLTPLPSCESPRIRVRAAVKTAPPVIWPTNDDARFSFDAPLLAQIAGSILSTAESMRARKLLGLAPWQMMGHWCSRFGRDCEMLEVVCRKRLNSTYSEPVAQFNSSDPANAALKIALDKNPDCDMTRLVILSASAYADYSSCAELYRLQNGGWFPAREDDNLGTGTCFHHGVAEFNRQFIKKES